MELDFSVLSSLNDGKAAAPAAKPAKPKFTFTGPTEPRQEPRQVAKPRQNGENQKQIKIILNQLKEEQGKIIAEHVEAQKKSRELQGEILQKMAKGENMAAVLLKALECVDLVTGESLFFRAGEKYISTIYGKALQEPDALAVTIGQARHRLELLKKAQEREQDPRERKLIETAIERTQKEINQLNKNL